MTATLAALLSVAAALLELTIFRYLRVAGVQPHPVLVLAVVWAVAVGIEGGIAAAFVGGLVLDVLAERPLGASAFALLLAVAIAAVLATSFRRLRLVAPIVTVFVSSLVNSFLFLGLYAALRGPVPLADPVATLMPGAVYDTVLAAVVGPLAVAIVDRRRDEDRVGW